MIGCTNRRADLGIPRTQAGRSGSGLEARRPSSRATARTLSSRTPILRRRPTPSLPPPRPATRSGTVSPGQVAAGSGPGGNEPPSVDRHRTRLLTLSVPVPPARARGSGWDGLNLHDGHQNGSAGQPHPARALGGYPGCSRCDGSGSWIAAAVPWMTVDRVAGPALGSGLPCVDRRELRHCGDGQARSARPETWGCPPGPPAGALDRRDVSPPRARRQSSRAVRWGGPGPLSPRVDCRGLRH
jgi:hypothetical protein